MQPVVAGALAAFIGFAASFAIVLTGLIAVGANPAQAASGLGILNLTTGLCSLYLALRFRMPIAVAWSTPGAALLASLAVPDGGYGVAVGAFITSSVLIVATGMVPAFRRWIQAIPMSLSSAMLAGVLLNICLIPVTSTAANPLIVGPVIVVWFLISLKSALWAVPGAVATAAVVMVWGGYWPADLSFQLTHFVWVTPQFSWAASISIAIPLFLVTMTSQNLAGMAVLKAFGYAPDLSAALRVTGAASVLNGFGGGHHVNLASLTAAMCANPDAAADPSRRYIAVVAAGIVFIAMGLSAEVMMQVAAAAPARLIESIAGLALLGALSGSLVQAYSPERGREGALVCFVITASGIAVGGIGSAFWGLVLGGLVYRLKRD
ncbi:benzoate/H(+) symporter BenE family transporter [Litorivicinus lipolyticus]|nr:benzoate/H(+) symporter BenE family transporter [Litorivicinus lipolyticus]